MFQLGDLVWVHLRKVSATFNVSDLSPYEDDDNLSNLKSSFAKQGEDDGGPSWTCHNDQNKGSRSEDHGQAVLEQAHPWQGAAWTKTQPSFVFSIC